MAVHIDFVSCWIKGSSGKFELNCISFKDHGANRIMSSRKIRTTHTNYRILVVISL